jgi:hypothetical protein
MIPPMGDNTNSQPSHSANTAQLTEQVSAFIARWQGVQLCIQTRLLQQACQQRKRHQARIAQAPR